MKQVKALVSICFNCWSEFVVIKEFDDLSEINTYKPDFCSIECKNQFIGLK